MLKIVQEGIPKMKSEKISMKDIAEMSGVSIATVSRVINQNGRFSSETEQRVMSIIEKYDFRPNELARGLRANKAQAVGVIVPDITNEFFACVVREIEIELLKKGYMAIVCDTNEAMDLEKKYIAMLKSLQVGGIIYIAGDTNVKCIENIPTVYVDREPMMIEDMMASTFIGSDNYQGGYIATRRLIDAGKKEIVLVLHKKSLTTQKRRLDGYKQAIRDAGMKFNENLIIKVENVDMDHGYEVTKKIFESELNPDGIFYSADILAIGGMRYLNKMKIAIPEQVSIIGFDDIPLSSQITPALTTVKQSYTEFGHLASESIVKMMNGDADYRKYILSVQLVERETV